MEIKYEYFFGALLGHAIGDALGAPIEGLYMSRIKPLISKLNIPYSFKNLQAINKTIRGKDRINPGLHTDDTQYMLVLLESIQYNDKTGYEYNIKKSLELFRKLIGVKIPGSRTGAIRGAGRNARTSFFRLLRNEPLNKIGTDSAGVGSAMRIGPPALLFMGNPKNLCEYVIKSSIITHLNVAGISAGYAEALLMIECYKLSKVISNSKNVDNDTKYGILEKIINLTMEFENNLLDKVEEIFPSTQFIINSEPIYKNLVSSAISEVLEINKMNINSTRAVKLILTKYKARKPSGFAPVGIAIAFYQVLKYLTEPVLGLCKTMELGGDTDTIGAMVGGPLFAANGQNKIPKLWKDKLYIYDYLKEKATSLLNRGNQKISTNSKKLIEVETELTRLLFNFQSKLKIQ